MVHPQTLRPPGEEIFVASLIKTVRVPIAHEAGKTGGTSAETAARILESEAFDYLDAPMKRLSSQDTSVPHHRSQERRKLSQADDAVAAARELEARSGRRRTPPHASVRRRQKGSDIAS